MDPNSSRGLREGRGPPETPCRDNEMRVCGIWMLEVGVDSEGYTGW